MFEPRQHHEQEHNENNHTLLGGRQSENAKEPFHLFA